MNLVKITQENIKDFPNFINYIKLKKEFYKEIKIMIIVSSFIYFLIIVSYRLLILIKSV